MHAYVRMKHADLTDDEFDAWLIDYALNRMLALDKENKHRAAGVMPSRRYKSRIDLHEQVVARAKQQ